MSGCGSCGSCSACAYYRSGSCGSGSDGSGSSIRQTVPVRAVPVRAVPVRAVRWIRWVFPPPGWPGPVHRPCMTYIYIYIYIYHILLLGTSSAPHVIFKAQGLKWGSLFVK